MATTPSKGKGAGKKAKQKRIYLALGLVALVVVGYVWYRSRSSSTSLAASPSGASSGFPPGDTGSAGGISGSPLDQSGQDLSGLLNALQAENQGLLDSFVANQGRLVTPFGGVATATDKTPAVAPASPAPAPAAAPAARSLASISPDLLPQAPASVQAETPTDLSATVATPNDAGIYPASPYEPFAPAGDQGGAYSASTTQGVFAVEPLAHPAAASAPAPEPYAVNISANKTGGSATKSQGVISVH